MNETSRDVRNDGPSAHVGSARRRGRQCRDDLQLRLDRRSVPGSIVVAFGETVPQRPAPRSSDTQSYTVALEESHQP